jgi:hypothetical protein
MTLITIYVSTRLAFWMSAFVRFCFLLSLSRSPPLKSHPSKPLLLKFGQKGLAGTDSHLICSLLPLPPTWDQNQPNKQKSRKEQILMMREKIMNWKPWTHPIYLVSEAKQGQAWLALRWEKDLQKRLLRDKQFGDKWGLLSKFERLCQTSQNKSKLRGLRKWLLCMCGYLTLKPFQTQTHIF